MLDRRLQKRNGGLTGVGKVRVKSRAVVGIMYTANIVVRRRMQVTSLKTRVGKRARARATLVRFAGKKAALNIRNNPFPHSPRNGARVAESRGTTSTNVKESARSLRNTFARIIIRSLLLTPGDARHASPLKASRSVVNEVQRCRRRRVCGPREKVSR